MRRKILLLLFFLFPVLVFARTWDLKTIVDYGVKKNVELKNAKRKIEMAKKDIIAAYGGFLPTVSLEGMDVLKETKGKISIPGPGGAAMTMEMDMLKNYQYSIKLTQPLFTGGALYFNLKNKIKEKKIAEENYRKKKMDVIYNISQAYYNLIYTELMLDVINESINIVKKQVEMVKIRYKNGEASNVDLLQAKVELNNLYPQKIKLETLSHTALLNLKNLIGYEENDKLNINKSFKMLRFTYSKDYKKLYNIAMKNLPDLKILELQREEIKNGKTILKGSYLPKVLLSASYGQQKEDWDDDWQENKTVSLVFSWSLFDGLKRETSISKMSKNEYILRDTLNDIKSKIDMAIKMKYESVVEAEKRMKAQQYNLQLAKENLDAATESYKNGLISLIDLMRARLGYNNARTGLIQAKYDRNLAILDFEKTIGVLGK